MRLEAGDGRLEASPVTTTRRSNGRSRSRARAASHPGRSGPSTTSRDRPRGAGIRTKAGVIRANTARYPISARCRMPGVPRSTYYWMTGHPGTERADPVAGDVRAVRRDSRGRYGAEDQGRSGKEGRTASGRRIGGIMRRRGMRARTRADGPNRPGRGPGAGRVRRPRFPVDGRPGVPHRPGRRVRRHGDRRAARRVRYQRIAVAQGRPLRQHAVAESTDRLLRRGSCAGTATPRSSSWGMAPTTACGGPTTSGSTPPSDTGARRNSPNRDSSSKKPSNTPLPIQVPAKCHQPPFRDLDDLDSTVFRWISKRLHQSLLDCRAPEQIETEHYAI